MDSLKQSQQQQQQGQQQQGQPQDDSKSIVIAPVVIASSSSHAVNAANVTDHSKSPEFKHRPTHFHRPVFVSPANKLNRKDKLRKNKMIRKHKTESLDWEVVGKCRKADCRFLHGISPPTSEALARKLSTPAEFRRISDPVPKSSDKDKVMTDTSEARSPPKDFKERCHERYGHNAESLISQYQKPAMERLHKTGGISKNKFAKKKVTQRRLSDGHGSKASSSSSHPSSPPCRLDHVDPPATGDAHRIHPRNVQRRGSVSSSEKEVEMEDPNDILKLPPNVPSFFSS